MKHPLYLLVFIFLFPCCSKKFQGVYKSSLCKANSPVCYSFDFDSSGTFNYKFQHYKLGQGFFKGTWVRDADTIRLFPKPRFHVVSTTQLIELTPSEFNTIILSKVTFFNDTIRQLSWFYKIDADTTFRETDSLGAFTLKKKGQTRLQIRDWLHDRGYSWINIKDSIFSLNLSGSSIVNIYVADAEKDPIFETMERLLIKKGNKLYPLSLNPTPESKKKTTYYFKAKATE
jgi:hypothetical protein